MARTTEEIISELRYEAREGTHTYTMCKCGRQCSRSYKCILCLKEELEERSHKPSQAQFKMKLIKSQLLQKNEGRKKGKYLMMLEVSDYDIEMLEDLSQCYCTVDEKTELKEKYNIWLKNIWHEFWKLWRNYDK